jgi:hypothetical protein
VYFHWGRMRHWWTRWPNRVQWPNREEAKNGFAFDRYGFYDPKLGRAQIMARRAEGRVRELVGDARRRLSKWRAATRDERRKKIEAFQRRIRRSQKNTGRGVS